MADIRGDLGDDRGRIVDDDDLVDLWGRAVALGTRLNAALAATVGQSFHTDSRLEADLTQLGGDLTVVERAGEDQRAREDARGWKEWLESDWKRGAKTGPCGH